ncbi:MAG: 2,3,4,5-tetrahydropyridine-2,6-dicarboxylate N-succinyltransferase, partial [Alphaproteobacteria bacterium]|nr:2,3,4,5-tetrahydropyridine-2,6-dicarboxylate N-succinyltransferase [Alphaproteobacteria bacterium]
MVSDPLQATIEAAWEDRDAINLETTGDVRDAVTAVLDGLDSGAMRVAEKVDGDWITHQWLKMAVLLSFRMNDSVPISGGPAGSTWFDKVPPKFAGWDEARFRASGIRAASG